VRPEAIRWQRKPVALALSRRISTGLVRRARCTPRARRRRLAPVSGHLVASTPVGTWTLAAPRRRAVRAVSMATLPPTTTTCLSRRSGSTQPDVARTRRPEYTSRSSPGSRLPDRVPVDTSTASNLRHAASSPRPGCPRRLDADVGDVPDVVGDDRRAADRRWRGRKPLARGHLEDLGGVTSEGQLPGDRQAGQSDRRWPPACWVAPRSPRGRPRDRGASRRRTASGGGGQHALAATRELSHGA
jgi:hypothetical protein